MSIWEMLKIEQTKDLEIIKNAYYTLVEEEHLDKDSPMLEILNMAYNSALYYATSTEDKESIINTTNDNIMATNATESINTDEPSEFESLYYNSSGIDFYDTDEEIEDPVENTSEITDASMENINNYDITPENNYDILKDLFFDDDNKDSIVNNDNNVTVAPRARDKFTLLKDELSQAIRDNNIILADRAAYSAMMLDPTDSELLALMGQLNFIKGDFKKSKDFFDKAFTIDRSSQDSLFIYAKTLSARKNFIDACKVYKEALDLDPSNLIIKYCLAVSYYHCKNYIESKILFDSIPLDAPYHFDINRYQESIEELITGKSFLTITEIPDIMKL